MELKSAFHFMFLAVLFMVAIIVSGNECRTSRTVAESARSVADNSAAGGHIWQHNLRGLTSGTEKSETQKDKTLFACKRKRLSERAWQKFQSGEFQYLKPYECKGKPKGQAVYCILASDIGVNIQHTSEGLRSKTAIKRSPYTLRKRCSSAF